MNTKIFPRIYRSDIFYVDFGRQPGSVIHGIRPAMVAQNDVGNWHSPTLIVAAITAEIQKLRQPTHVLIRKQFGLAHESMLMLEQLATIDKTALLTYVGTASSEFLEAVDKALSVSVGTHRMVQKINHYGLQRKRTGRNRRRRYRGLKSKFL